MRHRSRRRLPQLAAAAMALHAHALLLAAHDSRDRLTARRAMQASHRAAAVVLAPPGHEPTSGSGSPGGPVPQATEWASWALRLAVAAVRVRQWRSRRGLWHRYGIDAAPGLQPPHDATAAAPPPSRACAWMSEAPALPLAIQTRPASPDGQGSGGGAGRGRHVGVGSGTYDADGGASVDVEGDGGGSGSGTDALVAAATALGHRRACGAALRWWQRAARLSRMSRQFVQQWRAFRAARALEGWRRVTVAHLRARAAADAAHAPALLRRVLQRWRATARRYSSACVVVVACGCGIGGRGVVLPQPACLRAAVGWWPPRTLQCSLTLPPSLPPFLPPHAAMLRVDSGTPS